MNIPINYLAVLVCGVFSIVLGGVWYGALFGKKWMEFYGKANATPEEREKMMKDARPLYVVQFLVSLFELWVLAWFVGVLSNVSSGIHTAFGIWVAFVATTTLGAGLWTGDSKKVMIQKFCIQAGYQLIFFLVSGYILSVWK